EESDLWEYFEKHGYRRISFQFVLHEAEAFAHLADPLDETAGRRTPHLARRREDVLRAFDSDFNLGQCFTLDELEDVAGDLNAEAPVRFPLGFFVELVAGALVRKRAVSRLVLENVRWLAARQSGLDVHENALVVPVVVDGSHHGVLTGEAGWARLEHVEVNVDLDAKVFADVPGCAAKVVESHIGVRGAVGHDDVSTVAPHQFVEAEVVEVCAVREMNLGTSRATQAEHLLVIEPPGQPPRPGRFALWIVHP